MNWTNEAQEVVSTDPTFVPAKDNGVYTAATYTANFAPDTDTGYTVNHWQENLDNSQYTLAETEVKNGTTGAMTEAAAKNYAGFTAQAFVQETIAADGSTVVDIYYRRNLYTATVKYVDEETGAEIAGEKVLTSVKHGTTIRGEDHRIDITDYVYTGADVEEITADGMIVNVYYSVDEIGEQNPDEGDGIADKYQITVRYEAVNGTITSNAGPFVLTRKDAQGNPSENGTAYLNANQIGSATANAGYQFDSWTPSEPTTTLALTAHTVFTANFVRDETQWHTITFRAGANGSLNTGTLVIADVLTGTPFGEAVTSIPTPVANNGYHFTGWNNPIPADDAQVVGDMEFVANFAADPDPDPVNPGCPEGTVWSEEAQACIVPYVPPVTPEDPTDPTDPEEPAEVEEAEEENVEEEETPQQGGETTPTPSADAEEDIADEGTPEAGGRRTAWALVNLIASLLGILAAIVLLVSKHRKEVDSEDEERQMRIDRGEEDPQQVSRSRIYKVISVITAIVSVIVFVLTEDMRQPMILIDRWTLLMVIFLLINVVTLFLGRKWHEEDEEEGQNRA